MLASHKAWLVRATGEAERVDVPIGAARYVRTEMTGPDLSPRSVEYSRIEWSAAGGAVLVWLFVDKAALLPRGALQKAALRAIADAQADTVESLVRDCGFVPRPGASMTPPALQYRECPRCKKSMQLHQDLTRVRDASGREHYEWVCP